MAEPEIDEDTLRAAGRGERVACKRFVERYQSLVFSLASRVLGRGSPDVEDAAQEAFLRAFAAVGEFDPRGPARVSTWLATIATRVSLDAARRRRPVVSLDDARNATDHALRDPGEAMDDVRRRERLARAVDKLAPDQRAALALRVDQGMTYEQVAGTMGVEVGTVKSRLARARQALLAAVGNEDGVKDGHG